MCVETGINRHLCQLGLVFMVCDFTSGSTKTGKKWNKQPSACPVVVIVVFIDAKARIFFIS